MLLRLNLLPWSLGHADIVKPLTFGIKASAHELGQGDGLSHVALQLP
jgi:hypothetical protein